MRLLAPLLLAVSLPLVACGGTVAPGAGSDAGDAGDAPIARVPLHHRAAPTTCSPSPSSGGCTRPGGGGGGPDGTCSVDADCTAGKNGHCTTIPAGIFMCGCTYDECSADSECKGGGPCACAGSPYVSRSNVCAPSGNCKVDADCPGSYCSPSSGSGCDNGLSGYYCHTKADECTDDADCASSSGMFSCRYDTTKAHWACSPILACA